MATENVRDVLQAISARIDAVGRLHRLLNYSHDRAYLDLSAYLREIADAAILSVGDRMRLSFDLASDCTVASKTAAGIGLIVCEAVMNAIKYSHPDGVRGKILLSLRVVNNNFEIAVADDGSGLPKSFDPKSAKSTGFVIMHALASQLGAALNFESNPAAGLCVRLQLPKSNDDVRPSSFGAKSINRLLFALRSQLSNVFKRSLMAT